MSGKYVGLIDGDDIPAGDFEIMAVVKIALEDVDRDDGAIEVVERVAVDGGQVTVVGGYCLSTNEGLPWSLELIERFARRWDWEKLAKNESLPGSLELIERFAERWAGLAGKFDHSLPLLLPADIVAVLSHHFTEVDTGTSWQLGKPKSRPAK